DMAGLQKTNLEPYESYVACLREPLNVD
ncbi:hypothetical protein SAMN05428936_1171, partial [Pelagibacterium halotolerans]